MCMRSFSHKLMLLGQTGMSCSDEPEWAARTSSLAARTVQNELFIQGPNHGQVRNELHGLAYKLLGNVQNEPLGQLIRVIGNFQCMPSK